MTADYPIERWENLLAAVDQTPTGPPSGRAFSSQAGLAGLRHGRQVTLTPQNVRGMVPAEGEQAWCEEPVVAELEEAEAELLARAARVIVREQSSGLCEYGRVCDECDCFADAGGGARDAYALDLAKALAAAGLLAARDGHCGAAGPNGWRCTRPSGHAERHGYAGCFWTDNPNTASNY